MSWIDGWALRASVKQIIHISSPSCVNFGSFDDEDRWHFECKHKHFSSFAIPLQKWPQERILLHASAAYSWHCCSAQTFPTARRPVLPVVPQNRQRPTVSVVPPRMLLWPSRNSTIPLRVLESANASNQKSLVRPQFSCSSTDIASSSSLHNVR